MGIHQRYGVRWIARKFLSKISTVLELCVIGIGKYLDFCDDGIFTSQIPSELFCLPLSTGSFLALNIVTPFFVNKYEKSESNNWTMERRLELSSLGKRWELVAWDGKLVSGRFPCLVCLMIKLLVSQTRGTRLVECRLCQITSSQM